MANEIKPLTQAAPFVEEPVAKINEIVRKIKPLLNLKAGRGIVITPSGSDILFSVSDEIGGGGLPDGEAGDMLVNDGDGWVVVPKPTGMTVNPSLRYNLETDTPYWEEPEGC